MYVHLLYDAVLSSSSSDVEDDLPHIFHHASDDVTGKS